MSVSKNRNIIFDAGLSSLGARTRPPAGGAVARSDSPPDCHSIRALRVTAYLHTDKKTKGMASAIPFIFVLPLQNRSMQGYRTKTVHDFCREGILIPWL